MNALKKILVVKLLAGLFFMTSCNHDDFLTRKNPNAITEPTFWKTEADAEAALTTVYAALQFQSVSGGHLTYEMIRSDLGGTNDWVRHFPYTELVIPDNSTPVFNKWAECYNGIFRANQVIDNVPTIEEISEERKEEILSQARFLRAFFYFEVAHTFGGGVIKTSSKITDHNVPFSTIVEVTGQVIIPDLQYAIEHLPLTRPESDLGRATWGMATTLLGKVYLYNKEWSNAAVEFKKVIDSGLYQLSSNYAENFRHDVIYNSESIMEVPFDGSINSGAQDASIVDDGGNVSGGESTKLARWYGPYSLGGWQGMMPTYWAHELLVADSVAGSDAHSSRYTATLAGRDAEGLYYNKTAADLKAEVGRRWGNGESSYVKKYANWYHMDTENIENRSSINYKHMRLSDVYLMYAEAVLEASSDLNTAIEYIDKVRSRAGVVTIQDYISNDGGIPQLHISQDLYGAHPIVPATLENIRTHLRMVERPTELAFENTRWRDLVRWGMVKDVFTSHHNDEVLRIENFEKLQDENEVVPILPPLYIEGRIRPDFVNNWSFYSPDQHDYFPIPAAEVQANEAI
ncbi:RagB/SusD family nutrient uptake outer membrane protein [Flammeovirga sp. EKP202]|uniref:RagB/SusD family nutrient uptake outer membrane protein n=1 Tax=Flammeovirga sp. EKP202 TaxID=2770592 RepID=UPI00165F249B|nr:RagB/SusD family nutrient uptake outer membrane protein [Flammeovirga sp. EKP202]MBD0401775.1 RagB/SusD family nutrient uptake outer membrane protein [Flammeovirga sp. EKP202]